jgi:TolA-binding protein
MPERHEHSIPPEDLLAAYELGLLEPEERARVEQALASDPDLLDDLYDGAPAALAMQADPGRFARAADRAAAAARPAARRGWLAWLRAPRLMVPIAAAAVLVAVITWPSGQDGDLAGLAVLEPLPTVQIELRSGAQDADRQYEAAMSAYRDGRWDQASAGFTASLAVAEQGWARADQARLYAGSSLLLAGRVGDAQALLRSASRSALAPVREPALWQLAQAQLSLGEVEAARSTLEALQASPVYGERASDLLADLPQR